MGLDRQIIAWPLRALPETTTAGRFPLDDDAHRVRYQSVTHALHLHGYHGTLRLGGRDLVLAPGDVTLSPAGVASSYALQRPGHHWCIHFEPAAAAHGTAARVELPVHFSLGPQAAFGNERFRRISALYAQTRSGKDVLAMTSVSLLVQELLLWVAGQAAAGAKPVRGVPQRIDEALDKLVTILQARFTENLSIPELAAQLQLSQNYLARRFRERFHVTIPHYLVARRIEHACYLLTSTNMPIRRVGERVGMADPQYFNKQFRRLTGENPSMYREATRRQGT
jgi:AraC-like DNA-binding protein